MSAEAIATVVSDLRAGRIRSLNGDRELDRAGRVCGGMEGKVVDATAIYHSLVAKDEPIYIYEDHPCIAPPFGRADFCYRNEHGNAIVMAAVAVDRYDGKEDGTFADTAAFLDDTRLQTQPEGWEPAEPVDWRRVRWIIDTLLFIGGKRGDGRPFPTAGPAHCWRFAVYEDGTPADLHWIHLVPDYPMEHWDMAHLVLLGALNFLNCRNVDLVEPVRSRPERRRLARTGITVHELTVFPTGRAARGERGEGGAGVPLASVRGHFALYGPEHGRGLLFGKHSGRFWVPQHARGAREHGEHDSSYRLETG